MAAIISHTLPFGAGALWGGAKHAVFASVTGAMGIPQKLMNFTPPIAQHAFYYGAVSGMARYAVKHTSLELQKKSNVENYQTLVAINTAVLAAEILIRYATAQALSKSGMKIPLEYVTFSAACSSLVALDQIKTRADEVYYENNPAEKEKMLKEKWKKVEEMFGADVADASIGKQYRN